MGREFWKLEHSSLFILRRNSRLKKAQAQSSHAHRGNEERCPWAPQIGGKGSKWGLFGVLSFMKIPLVSPKFRSKGAELFCPPNFITKLCICPHTIGLMNNTLNVSLNSNFDNSSTKSTLFPDWPGPHYLLRLFMTTYSYPKYMEMTKNNSIKKIDFCRLISYFC